MGLRQLKADHLKRTGDRSLQHGNFREAYQRYSDALDLGDGSNIGLHKLYGNRSLAYNKAQRYQEAIADAERCIELAPQWAKGYWRLGMAFMGLKQTLQAIQAFADCWRLDHSSSDTEKQLCEAILKTTTDQLGSGMMALLCTAEQQQVIEPVKIEAVGEAEQHEAWHRHLSTEVDGQRQVEVYRRRYLQWLKQPMVPCTAYSQRASMYLQAKCYLQARWDAQQAVDLLAAQLKAVVGKQPKDGSNKVHAIEEELAEAYWRLGQAYAAQANHPDQDNLKAAKALSRAMDLAPTNKAVSQELQQVKGVLTLEQLAQVTKEVYNDVALLGLVLKTPLAHGILEDPAQNDRIYRMEVTMWFPQAKLTSFKAAARLQLRTCLADHLHLPLISITIEGIKSGQTSSKPAAHCQQEGTVTKACDKTIAAEQGLADSRPGAVAAAAGHAAVQPSAVQASPSGVIVAVHIQLGGAQVQGRHLAAALQTAPHTLLTDEGMSAALGPLHAGSVQAEVVDVTPGLALDSSSTRQADSVAPAQEAKPPSRDLIEVPKPKLEMAVPYKEYKLVHSDGSIPERTKKHPFCMSRVHYSETERGQEVWAQLADGSCRWRQTSSTITLLCLKIPAGTAAKHLHITLEPYCIRVVHRQSGEVYLEGKLERGIVPEESVWEHGGGVGQEGCTLYLHKMNLELLRRQWQHSEMWWPRLFSHHAAIQWDDYDKDYSDLPPQVMQQHIWREAIQDRDRQLESNEKAQRAGLQERDGQRKQRRQARLQVLRSAAAPEHVRTPHGSPAVA